MTPPGPTARREVLSGDEWRARAARHAERVRPWVEPRLRRMAAGERHPVEDFLFEYYSLRPAQLARWHPGLGIGLAEGDDYLTHRGYRGEDGVVFADPALFPPARREGLRWMAALLRATAERPAAWGCFGLHEWAMVYRAETVRHPAWPLRLGPEEIAGVVESLGLRCTHFDALRFFTPEARPRNRFQPGRANSADFEQPGCLHANMDLYKWAGKLLPYASSDLVADCFALARKIRELDMRASPYDLRALGLDPVRIEEPSGRADYETGQREFARRAAPLRERLEALCRRLLSAWREADAVSMVTA